MAEQVFNEQAYLALYPDVRAALGLPGVASGYDHFINFGQREGRLGTFEQPKVFNEQAYLAANPDVARAIGQPGVESGLAHYQNFGQKEGRQGFFVEPPPPQPVQDERKFDQAAYLAANPDVAQQIGLPGVESAFQHYENYGKNEGRQASFDVPESTAKINELSDIIYNKYKFNQNYDAEYK